MDRARALTLPAGRQKRRIGFDPSEPLLIPHRFSLKLPPPNGADIAFCCISDMQTFYCKEDKNGRAIRATEMIATRLAGEVGILTPHCSVMEDQNTDTYFGSLAPASLAADFEVRAYLTTVPNFEIGAPDPWLGRYLSALYAFDLFIANPDRASSNFLMAATDRQICAYDFASADLKKWAAGHFSIVGTNTLSLGRLLRKIHGFDLEAALAMVKLLEAIPAKVIRRFIGELPKDWLNENEGERLSEGWENGMESRLAALSAGLRNGSLL